MMAIAADDVIGGTTKMAKATIASPRAYLWPMMNIVASTKLLDLIHHNAYVTTIEKEEADDQIASER